MGARGAPAHWEGCAPQLQGSIPTNHGGRAEVMPEFFQVPPKPEWNFYGQHELKGIQSGFGDTGAKSLLVSSPRQTGWGGASAAPAP